MAPRVRTRFHVGFSSRGSVRIDHSAPPSRASISHDVSRDNNQGLTRKEKKGKKGRIIRVPNVSFDRSYFPLSGRFFSDPRQARSTRAASPVFFPSSSRPSRAPLSSPRPSQTGSLINFTLFGSIVPLVEKERVRASTGSQPRFADAIHRIIKLFQHLRRGLVPPRA